MQAQNLNVDKASSKSQKPNKVKKESGLTKPVECEVCHQKKLPNLAKKTKLQTCIQSLSQPTRTNRRRTIDEKEDSLIM